MQTTDTGV